jgi:hypothetical protein
MCTPVSKPPQQLGPAGRAASPIEASGIWDDIWHLVAHNSTAIEATP